MQNNLAQSKMQILLRELIFMLKQLNIPHMQNTKHHLVMPNMISIIQ